MFCKIFFWPHSGLHTSSVDCGLEGEEVKVDEEGEEEEEDMDVDIGGFNRSASQQSDPVSIPKLQTQNSIPTTVGKKKIAMHHALSRDIKCEKLKCFPWAKSFCRNFASPVTFE